MLFPFLPRKDTILETYLVRYIDPLGQPKVTTGRDHCFSHMLSVHPYLRTSPLFKSRKNKTIENNVRYQCDYGSSRVDHWDDSCLVLFCFQSHKLEAKYRWLATSLRLGEKKYISLLLPGAYTWLQKKLYTRQVSSMIHSARPTVSLVVNIVFDWNLLVLRYFLKWGRTDGRTEICAKTMITTGRYSCGSAEWINKEKTFGGKNKKYWRRKKISPLFPWLIPAC